MSRLQPRYTVVPPNDFRMPQSRSSTSSGGVPCPSCGTPNSGRFCTECGAVIGDVTCRVCGVRLTPGARFCHDCGAQAGAAAAPAATRGARTARSPRVDGAPARSNLPWILAGTAFVVLVVIFAAQRAGEEPAGGAPMAGGAPAAGAGPGAVDISAMSPQERASRLFDRIMRLSEEGKRDSVAFFATMALGVYESLGPLDLDSRYDYGRVAQVSGSLDLAQAQADTILRQSPDHLLGLVLSIAVADGRGDTPRRQALERQLLGVEAAQRAKALEEYARHQADIDAALAAARGRQ